MQEQTALTKAPTQEDLVEYQAGMERALQVVEIQTDQGPVKLTPAIVRRYLAVGDASKFTDQDLTLFMAMCKFHQLNPFIREVWPIKFQDNLQIVVAKDTFIKRAAEDPNIQWWKAGIIVYSKEEKRFFDTQGLIPPGTELIGAFCEVQEAGKPHVTRLEVNLDEYDKHRSTWKEIKSTMLRKVAIVQALRETAGRKTRKLYIPDELGLDPDKMPEGAIDVELIRGETEGPSPGPPIIPKNGNGQAGQSASAPKQEEDKPTGNLPKRRRANKFTGLNLEVFPGGKIETAGCKPDQLERLANLKNVPGNTESIKKFLVGNVGYEQLSYLREEEADLLLRTLKPVETVQSQADKSFQEDTFDPSDSAFERAGVVEDPVPGEEVLVPAQGGEEKVFCPQEGETMFKTYCLQDCRMRKQDGFCLALGEKPSSKFMG